MEFTDSMLLEVFQMIERMMIFFVGLVIGYLWGTSPTIKPDEKKEAEQLMGDPAIIAESDDDEEAEHVLGDPTMLSKMPQTVLISQHGKKFHLAQECSGLRNAITLPQIRELCELCARDCKTVSTRFRNHRKSESAQQQGE